MTLIFVSILNTEAQVAMRSWLIRKIKLAHLAQCKQEHLSLEPKPDSVVYIQGNTGKHEFVLTWNSVCVSVNCNFCNDDVLDRCRERQCRRYQHNSNKSFESFVNSYSSSLSKRNNYHSTISGDCYYIPDIDGSLLTRTWSKAFEFCQENSLNMWIIDSEVEEVQVKILWQNITGGQYNFRHKQTHSIVNRSYCVKLRISLASSH